VAQGTVYTVDHISDDRVVDGQRQYLTHWKGFGPESGTWEPYSSFIDSEVITDYHRRKNTHGQ
jgi:hypothetical protein